MACVLTNGSAAEACALYLRRSARNDVGMNRSLEEQELETRAYAGRLGLTVVRVYAEREGASASIQSDDARPAWDAALADLHRGADFHTLIVHAQSRSTRRGAGSIAQLLDRHAHSPRRILSLDGMDTGDPRKRAGMLLRAEMDRDESERISARVSRTKRYRRAEGRWLGGKPPFGLRIVAGHLEPDPVTHPVARRIADALLDGQTLYGVCAWLNAERIPAPSDPVWRGGAHEGRRWRIGSLSALVRTPGFAGLQSIRVRALREDGTPERWPASAEVFLDGDGVPVSVGTGVITPDERSRILKGLERRTAVSGGSTPAEAERRSARSFSLLRGLLRCASCGTAATVVGAGRHASYRCGDAAQGPGRCDGFSALRAPLEAHVARSVMARLALLEAHGAQIGAAG